MNKSAYLKLILGILIGISGAIQLMQVKTWWFIQNVNLIFHEPGHIIFGIFGDFLGLIGGSLLEMLIPIIVTIHFFKQRYYFSTAFGCWWVSTALLSVSIYATDAQTRILPLITGDIESHDWYNILSQLGLLHYDYLFGSFFFAMSALSICLIFYFLLKDPAIRIILVKNSKT